MPAGQQMQDDTDWFEPIEPKTSQQTSQLFDWGNNLLRATMLFGMLAAALAMFAAPYLDRSSKRIVMERTNAGIDFTTTASTPQQRPTYTVRRSVLQDAPNAVCIIHANGARSGYCAR